MRLAIDATPVVAGRKGLGVFFERLLDAIEAQGLGDTLRVYVDRTYRGEATRRWRSLHLVPVSSRPSLMWELRLPARLARDQITVLLSGRDRTVCEPRARTMVYLFETPDHRVRAQFEQRIGWKASLAGHYLLARFRRVARRVSRFVVSSRATGKDLERSYGVPSERIAVVSPGTDDLPARFCSSESEREAARTRFAAGRPYVLHFATGDRRENSVVAVRSFAGAMPRLTDDQALLLVGTREATSGRLLALAAELGIAKRVVTVGYLTNGELRLAYSGASAYLDPTLFEGFGFQLAEAMAAGVPVIASNTTSVPEVVGDAGLLFAPDDVDGFGGGLVRVLSNDRLRDELVSRGIARCRTRRWSETASRLLEEMRSLGEALRG